MEHLEKVFAVLQDPQQMLIYSQKKTDYLGHAISKKGVEMDNHKIESIMSWPIQKLSKN